MNQKHKKKEECTYPECECELPCLNRPVVLPFDHDRNSYQKKAEERAKLLLMGVGEQADQFREFIAQGYLDCIEQEGVEELKKQVINLRQKSAKSEEKCKTYMHRCDELNEKLASEKKDIKHLKGKIDEIEKMIRDRDAQIAKLKEALEESLMLNKHFGVVINDDHKWEQALNQTQ